MKSENDICSYVRKLSKIVFNYISETYAEYLFSFPSEKLLSCNHFYFSNLLNIN